MIVGVDTKSVSWHAVGLREGLAPMTSRSVVKRGTLDAKRQRLAEDFDSLLGAAVLISQATQESLHVFCEHPLALQNPKTTLALGMAAGALWDRHTRHDLYWWWVEVSSWQSMVGVSLGSDSTAQRKAKSKQYAIENAGLAHDLDEDHYDAANNALWGARELAKLPGPWRPEPIGATG